MPTPIQKAETRAVGNRLREFRYALADFKEEFNYRTLRFFADKTGVDEDNLTNWELGRSLVPLSYIERLKDQFGISYLFEWIYGNDARGLPARLLGGSPPPSAPTKANVKVKSRGQKKGAA